MGRSLGEETSRLDIAAKAGWLYYVAGKTQEEIAQILKLSRPSVQRLVSLSMSAGLVKMRIDHPISSCMELADELRAKFGLTFAEVTLSDPTSASTVLGIAESCASEMERRLSVSEPTVLAVGTGRTLKEAVKRMPSMHCPQHRIVSLAGNVGLDGSASVYNVVFSMADKVQAPHYPMPVPVVASSPKERTLLHDLSGVRSTLQLAMDAQSAFVGIGDVGPQAPLVLDGYITPEEVAEMQKAGAAGEICGWLFDAEGAILDCAFNARVASAPIPSIDRCEVIAVAMGPTKKPALAAALGRLVNGVITDERTARSLLGR